MRYDYAFIAVIVLIVTFGLKWSSCSIETKMIHPKENKMDISRAYFPSQTVPSSPLEYDSYNSSMLKNFASATRNQYDYPFIQYPVAFNELYRNKSFHYEAIERSQTLLPDYVNLGDVMRSNDTIPSLLFVTGSSSNHLFATINCLYSIVAYDANASFVFVDFGITAKEAKVLIRHLNRIHSFHLFVRSRACIYYRRFAFSSFPSWFAITNYFVGGYSWKVISYMDVIEEYRGPVVWTDGGSLLNLDMSEEWLWMKAYGIYSPVSRGNVGEWVHPLSISFLQMHHMINHVDLNATMCTGGYLFIDGGNKTVMRMLEILRECAYTKKCISPEGTNRLNHRQDQAILTMLLHDAGIEKSCDPSYEKVPQLRADCLYRNNCVVYYTSMKRRFLDKYGYSL